MLEVVPDLVESTATTLDIEPSNEAKLVSACEFVSKDFTRKTKSRATKKAATKR
jgi:hypothetical protein